MPDIEESIIDLKPQKNHDLATIPKKLAI